MKLVNLEMKKIYLLILFTLGLFSLKISAYDIPKEMEKLQSELSKATLPDDSIRILYNLYDICPRKEKTGVGAELLELARRQKRYSESLDILRLMAGASSDQAVLTHLLELAKNLPDSRERTETILFIEMKKVACASRTLNYKQQNEAIGKLVTTMKADTGYHHDPYKQMLTLYTVAAFLRNDPSSETLINHIDSLINLVNHSNYQLYALPNLIYSEAANIYTDAGQRKKAIEADKHMLSLINSLETLYRNRNRKYRNYNTNRYISYRRMLRNYEGLAPGEANRIYSHILELINTDADTYADFKNNHSVLPYYYMAVGKYSQAIPEIKQRLEKETALPAKNQLVNMLITAARETGDTTTLVDAILAHNDILQMMNRNDADKRYKELQSTYDLNSLRSSNMDLTNQMAQQKKESGKNNMTLTTILWIVVAVLLTILLYYWTKYHSQRSRSLRLLNNIKSQRDKLKTKVYSDYREDGRKTQPLPHKASPLSFNKPTTSNDIIEEVLTSILYISAIGRDEREKYISEVSMSTIMDKTKRAIDKLYNPKGYGEVRFDYSVANPEFALITDLECLVYILSHILEYAAKAADKGYVSMDVTTDYNNKEVRFKFSHSGSKIPDGVEEILFRNFVNMDELRKKEDNALFLCRLNAFLLRCRISYNPLPEGPATLYFITPAQLKK